METAKGRTLTPTALGTVLVVVKVKDRDMVDRTWVCWSTGLAKRASFLVRTKIRAPMSGVKSHMLTVSSFECRKEWEAYTLHKPMQHQAGKGVTGHIQEQTRQSSRT